jgi:hypothetical protein
MKYDIKIFLLTITLLIVYFVSVNNDTKTVHSEYNKDNSLDDIESRLSTTKKNLIFCIILTTPQRLRTRAMTVLYVWASKCSNYKFVTFTPERLSHPDNSTILKDSPFNILHPKGLLRENYTELTDKVYYAFRDIYEEFGDTYDWYLKADGN